MIAALTAILYCSLPQASDGDRFVIWGKGPEVSSKIALRVGTVLPVSGPRIGEGVVLIRGRKIERVGAGIDVPADYEVREFPSGVAVPGFVDLHVHIAGGGGDLNEMIIKSNPELRTLDTVLPENPQLRLAVAGGVTTALFIPGSGTSIGGLGTLLKTHGNSIDEMLIRFPGALKIAQGNNPLWGNLGNTHMGNNWIIRSALREAKNYHERWDRYERGVTTESPEKIGRLEALRGLFAREYPAAVHTQYFHVLQATYRILVDELDVWTVFDHSTFDAFKNAEAVRSRGIVTICGPRMFWFDTQNSKFWGVAASWHERGVTKIGINTDAPVVPAEELTTQVAIAIRYGLPEEAALKGVTIVPARAMGIDHRVGSLEAGKDADVVVWSGDPFDARSYVLLSIINGRVAYDPSVEGRRF